MPACCITVFILVFLSLLGECMVWVDERGATCRPHHGVLLFRPGEREYKKPATTTRKLIHPAKLCFMEILSSFPQQFSIISNLNLTSDLNTTLLILNFDQTETSCFPYLSVLILSLILTLNPNSFRWIAD